MAHLADNQAAGGQWRLWERRDVAGQRQQILRQASSKVGRKRPWRRALAPMRALKMRAMAIREYTGLVHSVSRPRHSGTVPQSLVKQWAAQVALAGLMGNEENSKSSGPGGCENSKGRAPAKTAAISPPPKRLRKKRPLSRGKRAPQETSRRDDIVPQEYSLAGRLSCPGRLIGDDRYPLLTMPFSPTCADCRTASVRPSSRSMAPRSSAAIVGSAPEGGGGDSPRVTQWQDFRTGRRQLLPCDGLSPAAGRDRRSGPSLPMRNGWPPACRSCSIRGILTSRRRTPTCVSSMPLQEWRAGRMVVLAGSSISRLTIRSTRTSCTGIGPRNRPAKGSVKMCIRSTRTGAIDISSSSIATRRAASAACSSTT